MRILAIESSAGPASCAVWEDGELLACAAVNTRLTHSQTLLPMAADMLKNAGLTLESVDVLAAAVGPGSFTGVRIGVAAVKGLAFAQDKPCAGVSTLAAMARGLEGLPMEGMICPVMDARCRQVYTAAFSLGGGKAVRQTPDEAISLEELKCRLLSIEKPILLVGDGAVMCYNELNASVPFLRLAPARLRLQHAAGVAAEAARLAETGELCRAEQLLPAYLRLPQAERELRARQCGEKTTKGGH